MINIMVYLRWKVQREAFLLFLYTFLCNLALINSGATMGYSAIALPSLTNNTQSSISLNTMEIPLFASIVTISQVVGCFVCLITMNYGRRCTMIVCSVNYSLGWILIASSYNVIQLFIGRALTGIAVGLTAPATEIYLSEISLVSWKESITVTPTIAFTAGTLVVYILGFVIQNNWRLVAALFSILSVSLVVCNIFFIPESPQWLLLKGRKEEARITLLRIRGLRQETKEFQDEFDKMANYIKLTNNLKRSQNNQMDSFSSKKSGQRSFLTWNVWNILKTIRRTIILPEVWKPYVILNLYFIFQVFTGPYVVIFYTVDLITRINITLDPFLVTVIVGVVQLMGSLIAAYSSRRIGRRPISIVSGVGISMSLGALVIYLQFFEDIGVVAIPLVCILLFVAFELFGFFTIPWSMIPELYPSKYINVLSQLTVLTSIFCSYITVQLYPMMVNHDRNATFYFYCIISILATVFLMVALPETRGKTKTQIEEGFKGNVQMNETFRKIEDAH